MVGTAVIYFLSLINGHVAQTAACLQNNFHNAELAILIISFYLDVNIRNHGLVQLLVRAV